MKQFVFYSKNVEFKSKVDEKGTKRHYVKGYVTSGDLDLVNDIITKSCMEDINEQLKSRTIKLDLDHETLIGDNELEKAVALTKPVLGKAINFGVDDKGNYVEFELNPNYKKYDSKGNIVKSFKEIWEEVKSGFYDAFSIAFVPVKAINKTINETKARLLDKVNLINVALTGNPINPAATMTSVMAKSLDYLNNEDEIVEIKSRLKDLEDKLNLSKKGDIMKEEKEDEKKKACKKSEEAQTEEVTPEQQAEEQTQEEAQPEQPKEEAPAEEAPAQEEAAPESEQKSIDSKAFAELKSIVEKQNKAIEEINKILSKAVPNSKGAENAEVKSKQNEVPKGAGTLDYI